MVAEPGVIQHTGSFAGLADANYTIRGERYKYLRHAGTEEFYDLLEDPYEHVNLLDGRLTAEQEARLGQLRDQFAALRASDSSDGRYMR